MVADAWLCSLKYPLTPPSLAITHTPCGCSSDACSRTCQHKPVTRAGLQFFTVTLARGHLWKQSCECLSPDGTKYFYTSLPQSLSLCITARRRYGRKIRAARRRREQVNPNLQLYFSGFSTQLFSKLGSEENKHELPSGDRARHRRAPLCSCNCHWCWSSLQKFPAVLWFSLCLCLQSFLAVLGVSSPGSGPHCCGGVHVSPC